MNWYADRLRRARIALESVARAVADPELDDAALRAKVSEIVDPALDAERRDAAS